ncbi:MAG TPA: GspE/PulE family protein [Mycobacteriales bacterium]|nr:GspE/PulE family protein [Mycobacteriales bacterium]
MRLGRASKAPGAGLDELLTEPDPRADRRLLGDLLVEQAGVTPAQVAEAMLVRAGTGKRLGSVLVEAGVIDERQLTEALSAQLGLPVADLRSHTPEPEAVALLSDSLARGLGAVPLRIDAGGVLEVVVADAGGTTRSDLEKATGRRVQLLLAPPGDVRRVIDSTYRALADIEQQVAAFSAGQSGRAGAARGVEAPVVQIVDKLITQALRDRASDVHIEPQDEQVRVRFRIDGALHDVITLPDAMGGAIASRIKVVANMNIVERRRPQDGQIAMTIDGRPIDIRVATTGTVFGEKVVLRLLDKSRPLFRLADLGMPPATEKRFAGLVRSPYGMVICAGPTGSGKTTTLYASVSEINGVERNITTIEDPVEYVFPSLNQIQINEQAGVTFAAGLRSILRQDPDVILVGEIRDVETARIAVQSALTGHFVLSSLHATDAVSALYRFLDMGIEAFLVASSVLAVVGQRLLRKTCPHCRVPYALTPEEEVFYRQAGGQGRTQFWVGAGCNLCSQTGYLDRVGVYELLQLTEEMRALIVAPNPSHDDMRRLALEQGMRSMRQEAIRLVDSDVTTVAEVVRTIYTL